MEKDNINCVVLCRSYQDTHNRAYYMVLAGTRWLGIRLDLLSALLIGAVALLAALYSQNNGEEMFYIAYLFLVLSAHLKRIKLHTLNGGLARNGRLQSYLIILVPPFFSNLQCDLHA